MKVGKLKCGCTYATGAGAREFWTGLCPAHKAEFDETHARWGAEHAKSEPLPEGPKPETRRKRK